MAALNPHDLLREHVARVELPRRLSGEFLESEGNQLPTAIYPEIRVLTADKVTRNRTVYPEASLRGKPSQGTGLISFLRPYAVPIIQDHNTGGGMCSEKSSEVFGRVHKTPQFVKELEQGYIKAIPKITHPEAIENILTQRWLTVSLGSRTESVKCSICNQELTEEFCDHEKGRTYEVGEDKDKKKVEAHWIIGPILAKEVSFVISPSDEEAGVLNPDVQLKESYQGTGGISRLLVGGKHGVYDLLSGARLTESALPLELEIPSSRANFYFMGWGR